MITLSERKYLVKSGQGMNDLKKVNSGDQSERVTRMEPIKKLRKFGRNFRFNLISSFLSEIESGV